MKEVIKLLKQGKTIVYPTDTAYALGGDFLNAKTRTKIYKIKKRDKSKELPAIANSLSMVKKYCFLNKTEERLAKKYWPGPLSIVLTVKPKFQKTLGPAIAIRVPKNKIARSLSKSLNKPLVATSANISGKTTCYNVKNVLKQFSKSKVKPDIVIDDGELKQVPTSTIVRVDDGKVKVLRKGNAKVPLIRGI
jgi:L-threonylcarbamoyladenylate synthase